MRRRQAIGALVMLTFFVLLIAALFAWPEVSSTLRYVSGGMIALGLLVMAVGVVQWARRRRS